MEYKKIQDTMQKRIIQLTDSNKITMKQLSISINKSPDYIHKVVIGKITPTLPVLVDICNQLGITLTELLDDTIPNPIEYNKVTNQLPKLSKEKLNAILTLIS